MPESTPIRRALVSVSDKTGLIEFAAALVRHGVEIISTGGTARALHEAGLQVTPVERVTGCREIMDGRVKTLHPAIHAAILADRARPAHMDQIAELGIEPIDLVCVNLYPFVETIARAGVSDAEAIEQIDIGGPSMIRAAAKNHAGVAVITSASQYAPVVDELDRLGGRTSPNLRANLAVEAFALTATYDAAIAGYMGRHGPDLPERVLLGGRKVRDLRYGENPHQPAALYANDLHRGPSVVGAQQLAGKTLSYNNINDASSALALAIDLTRLGPAGVGACVIKHANPCGAAIAEDASRAVAGALAGDPLAAYGGILAIGATLDTRAAEQIVADGTFLEVIVAPRFEPEAERLLAGRWKNVRLLAVGELDGASGDGAPRRDALAIRVIEGGLLAQRVGPVMPTPDQWTHAAGPEPDPALLRAAGLVEVVGSALMSNAVAIGGPVAEGSDQGGGDQGARGSWRLFGAGAGQMDRMTACRIAVDKAGARSGGAIAYSDAFFPFPDGPAVLIDAGVAMIVHPGGSKRDQETFALCRERGVTCMTTGVRRFRH